MVMVNNIIMTALSSLIDSLDRTLAPKLVEGKGGARASHFRFLFVLRTRFAFERQARFEIHILRDSKMMATKSAHIIRVAMMRRARPQVAFY
jgi:hypothetical protein